MERTKIKARQKQGIAIAKAKGTYKGRKTGSIENRDAFLKKHTDIVKCFQRKESVRGAAAITKKSINTARKVREILNFSQTTA